MADIFISYSSRRRELTHELENRLAAQGYYSVWWDRELNPAAQFGPQIKEALNAAKAVLVIWTPEAVASAYVRAEARLAASANKLVSVRTSDTSYSTIPEPFGEYHIAELDNLDDILRGIAQAWTGAAPRNALLAEHYFRNTGRHVLAPKRETLTQVASVSPALLLNARLALAPYLDVHGLRADISQWANEGRLVRGRLIHGPGGLGKTRLMAEVTADLRKANWAAGFVEIPDAASAHTHRQALEQLIDTDRKAGLLLVLDYAERRQDEAARYAELMLKAAQSRPGRPLRLVLLARAAGEWWDRAVEETPALTPVFAGGVVQIAPFTEVAEREQLFTEACAGFRAAISEARRVDAGALVDWSLDERPIPDRLRQDLASDAFARPLMIQIAALLHLQGEAPDATSVATLLDAMLGVERRYWKSALGAAHTDQRQTALCRGTIQTTLVGGVARAKAEALLLNDGYFARAAAVDVAEPLSDLERIYGDGAGQFLALEPDLVGEHLMAADGDTRLIDACLDWAGEDMARRRAILTVLQRATRGEHGVKSHGVQAGLNHVLLTRAGAFAADLIAVAQETPGELPVLIERAAPSLDPDVADALNRAIPIKTLRLMRAAGALAARACAGAGPSDEAEGKTRAGRLAWLGSRLLNLGRRNEALAASKEAVAIYLELWAQNRNAFLPDLAWSLNSLGGVLSSMGRHEQALTASVEAAKIFRGLAARNRNAFLHDLAWSHTSRGMTLSNLGRHEEALMASKEAVESFRALAAKNRDAFLGELADSLNRLGIRLSNLGRHEEALMASKEAVESFRALAAKNRDTFLLDLAESLDTLGTVLSKFGRHEEALTASAEAVEIFREFAAQDRDRFLLDLACALSSLGDVLFASGQVAESVAAHSECATLLKPFAEAAPSAFRDLFVSNLRDLVKAMRAAGSSKREIAETIRSFGGNLQEFAQETGPAAEQ
jgi:tetratricopeptide (TPR) repeat protein